MKSLKLIWILIILVFLSLSWTATARAALQVSFISQPSPAELSVGEEGTWSVAVSNPDSQDAADVTLTVTLPADYTVTDNGSGTPGTPNTLTWTISNIPYGGESAHTFKARPNCGAASGGSMKAEVAPGGATAQSSQITVKTPVISVSLVDSNDNTVTDAAVGDPVVLTLTIDNSGTGDTVHGTMVTFDLGSALSYDTSSGNPVSSSTSHALPDPPTGQQLDWNTGPVFAGTKATYEIKTVVSGCDRNGLTNNVSVVWDDGSGPGTSCVPPLTSFTSIALEVKEPNISITVTNPGPLQYCPGNPPTTAEITITNSGSGPAENFLLRMDNWGPTPGKLAMKLPG